MVELRYNQTLPRDYASLKIRCGYKLKDAEACIGAIKESLFTVGIYHDDEMLAFGRICGDGHLYMLVCDVLVDSRYADKNFDQVILKKLDEFLAIAVTSETNVLVLTEPKQAKVLSKMGYKYFDEDRQLVMHR